MEIYCLSEGELYRIENGKEKRIPCERVESYRDAVRKMKARDEWKTTGKGAKYTRGRGPLTLVYTEELADKESALRREHQIKALTRAEKLALCATWQPRKK